MANKEVVVGVKALPSVSDKPADKLLSMLGESQMLAVLGNPHEYDKAVRDKAKRGMLMILEEIVHSEKIKSASLSSLAKAVPVLADVAGGKYQFLEVGDLGAVDKEEIMMKLQVAVKRIKGFNPSLSNSVKEAMDGVVGANAGEVTKAIDAEYKEVKGGGK